MSAVEQRAGVDLTNLDQPLSPDAGASKRDLVDYLDAVADRMVPALTGRPLTVLRVLRGQGGLIPVARVAAMHEGKRRARAGRAQKG